MVAQNSQLQSDLEISEAFKLLTNELFSNDGASDRRNPTNNGADNKTDSIITSPLSETVESTTQLEDKSFDVTTPISTTVSNDIKHATSQDDTSTVEVNSNVPEDFDYEDFVDILREANNGENLEGINLFQHIVNPEIMKMAAGFLNHKSKNIKTAKILNNEQVNAMPQPPVQYVKAVRIPEYMRFQFPGTTRNKNIDPTGSTDLFGSVKEHDILTGNKYKKPKTMYDTQNLKGFPVEATRIQNGKDGFEYQGIGESSSQKFQPKFIPMREPQITSTSSKNQDVKKYIHRSVIINEPQYMKKTKFIPLQRDMENVRAAEVAQPAHPSIKKHDFSEPKLITVIPREISESIGGTNHFTSHTSPHELPSNTKILTLQQSDLEHEQRPRAVAFQHQRRFIQPLTSATASAHTATQNVNEEKTASKLQLRSNELTGMLTSYEKAGFAPIKMSSLASVTRQDGFENSYAGVEAHMPLGQLKSKEKNIVFNNIKTTPIAGFKTNFRTFTENKEDPANVGESMFSRANNIEFTPSHNEIILSLTNDLYEAYKKHTNNDHLPRTETLSLKVENTDKHSGSHGNPATFLNIYPPQSEFLMHMSEPIITSEKSDTQTHFAIIGEAAERNRRKVFLEASDDRRAKSIELDNGPNPKHSRVPIFQDKMTHPDEIRYYNALEDEIRKSEFLTESVKAVSSDSFQELITNSKEKLIKVEKHNPKQFISDNNPIKKIHSGNRVEDTNKFENIKDVANLPHSYKSYKFEEKNVDGKFIDELYNFNYVPRNHVRDFSKEFGSQLDLDSYNFVGYEEHPTYDLKEDEKNNRFQLNIEKLSAKYKPKKVERKNEPREIHRFIPPADIHVESTFYSEVPENLHTATGHYAQETFITKFPSELNDYSKIFLDLFEWRTPMNDYSNFKNSDIIYGHSLGTMDTMSPVQDSFLFHTDPELSLRHRDADARQFLRSRRHTTHFGRPVERLRTKRPTRRHSFPRSHGGPPPLGLTSLNPNHLMATSSLANAFAPPSSRPHKFRF